MEKSISQSVIDQREKEEKTGGEPKEGIIEEESMTLVEEQEEKSDLTDIVGDQEGEKDGIEGIAEDLNVNLPNVNLPLPLKFIAVFTLIGGLSVVGSVFADIFNPNGVSFKIYILRIVSGVILIAVSYGIIKKRRWSLWLYAVIIILGLFMNPVVSVLPFLVLVYLYFKRKHFAPSFIDRALSKWFNSLEHSFDSKK